MRDLRELGILDISGSSVRPPPTSAHIALLEDLLGVEIPPAYLALLMFSNGGCPQLRDIGTEGSLFINNFFHLWSDDSTENVMWQYRHRWPGAPREMLPIADNGFGDKFCIDLTESGKGRVVIWFHEMPDAPIVEVAGSFEEFIDSLEAYSEGD